MADHDALRAALVDSSPDIIVVLDAGTITYASPSVTTRMGWKPEDLVGRTIVDFVHPDDLERAAFDLELYSTRGTVPGYSTYRVALADGTWARYDASGADLELDGRRCMALYCRPDDSASASILDGLLRGTSTADTLRPVCDVINWHLHGSHVAITWWDDGLAYVSTGLPSTLAGADDPAGAPWVAVRREATGRRSTELVGVDSVRRELASDLGLGGYWIEPVLDEQSSVCALVTIWTREGAVPELHALGMSMAKDYTELIIRWSRQQRLLVDAARQDSLTGLANRTAFFESLAASGPHTVLYCDLDAFKPVNDELGHVAGDELLRAVAGRIKACVRTGDVVARLGGDEFAVLCAGVSDEQAHDLAERIRTAVLEPYRIGGTTARLGISIGVARSDAASADDVLERADRALYRAKADGGGAVRWPDDT